VNVKQLISELKKMPGNLEVGVSMHDNSDHEVAAWVQYTTIDTDNEHNADLSTSDVPGKKCVVLRC